MVTRTILIGISLTFLTACFESGEEKAMGLFNDANKAALSIKNNNIDYSQMYERHLLASSHLKIIHKDFNSTKVNYDLNAGDSKLAGLSLDKFISLEQTLLKLSKAEQDVHALGRMISEELTTKTDYLIKNNESNINVIYNSMATYTGLADYYLSLKDIDNLSYIMRKRERSKKLYEKHSAFSFPGDFRKDKFKYYALLEDDYAIKDTLRVLSEQGMFTLYNSNFSDYFTKPKYIKLISYELEKNKDAHWASDTSKIKIYTGLVEKHWDVYKNHDFAHLLEHAVLLVDNKELGDYETIYRLRIARVYKKIGMHDKYKAQIKIIEESKIIEELKKRTDTISKEISIELAKEYYLLGDLQQALAHLPKYSNSIHIDWGPIETLKLLYSMNEYEQINDMLSQIETDLPNNEYPNEALNLLIKYSHLINNKDKANHYFDVLLSIYSKRSNSWMEDDISESFDTQLELGNYEHAQTLYKLALNQATYDLTFKEFSESRRIDELRDILKLISNDMSHKLELNADTIIEQSKFVMALVPKNTVIDL
jgi:hypothetical protein